MKLTLQLVAAVLLAGAVILFAAGAITAEKALHPARVRVAALCPCIAHVQCRGAVTNAPDGTILRGWYFEPDRYNGGAVVALHGVGASREDMVALGAVFLRSGYAVLEPDLRGYGQSGGMTTYGVNEERDIQAWADWMLHQARIQRIYGFGVSLGGSVLLEGLNRERRFRAVIAESAYSGFRNIASERLHREMPDGLKWLTGAFVECGMAWTRLRYSVDLDRASALNAVSQTRVPVLLIHGSTDEKTSPGNSRSIAAANSARTQLWLVANGGYANAWQRAGKEFEKRVVQWFNEH